MRAASHVWNDRTQQETLSGFIESLLMVGLSEVSDHMEVSRRKAAVSYSHQSRRSQTKKKSRVYWRISPNDSAFCQSDEKISTELIRWV
jgi:hypothetical protein